MKLLDKLKDLFMDEVVEDDELELEESGKELYQEPPKDVLPKVMRDTIKEEEKLELKVKPEEFVARSESVKIEKTPVVEQQPVKKFSFPIDFEDELPSRNNKNLTVNKNVLNIEKEKEVTKKVSELYPKKEEVKTKPKFKATPVISPVYGILDKNYKKEEVKEKSEDTVEMKRPSKKVDFETVRKKAFGNLADEIKDNLMCENCELYKEVKKISALKEDDLLYEMTIDDEDEKEVTIERAYDNYEEFGVAYEPKIVREEETTSDEMLEDVEVNVVKEKVLEEIEEDKVEVPEERIPSRSEFKEEKKKETKVDADFFELIDSMYKERVDD